MAAGPLVSPPGKAAADEVRDTVRRPTEMLRIQSQLEALAVELRDLGTLPDEESRLRLLRAEQVLRDELGDVMGDGATSELHHLFDWLSSPDLTSDELRLGLRQMVGWVEGTLAGLQVVLMEAEAARQSQPS